MRAGKYFDKHFVTRSLTMFSSTGVYNIEKAWRSYLIALLNDDLNWASRTVFGERFKLLEGNLGEFKDISV